MEMDKLSKRVFFLGKYMRLKIIICKTWPIPVHPGTFRLMLVSWLMLTLVLYCGEHLPSYPVRGLTPQCFFKLSRSYARSHLLSLKFPVHTVKPGETFRKIARNYYVTTESLLNLNQMEDGEPLEAGKKLFIPPVNCQRNLLRHYRVGLNEKIDRLLQRWRMQKWELQRLNPAVDLEKVSPGQTLLIPRAKTLASRGGSRQLHLMKPVSGILSSPYGSRWGRIHWGIDLAAPYGTPVKAAKDGLVIYAGWRGGYGLLVILQHGPFRTYYGHMSQTFVQPGKQVSQGEIIGRVGSSGRSTGSHLHFELEVLKKKINPVKFFISAPSKE